jgi:hypothetical protein
MEVVLPAADEIAELEAEGRSIRVELAQGEGAAEE